MVQYSENTGHRQLCHLTDYDYVQSISRKQMSYQGRPKDVLGLGSLQQTSCSSTCSCSSCSLLPLGPDQLVLQEKQLEILIDLDPLSLLPLLVIKLHIYLVEHRGRLSKSITNTETTWGGR